MIMKHTEAQTSVRFSANESKYYILYILLKKSYISQKFMVINICLVKSHPSYHPDEGNAV